MSRVKLIIAILILVSCCSCTSNKTNDMSNRLEQYMQDVYAPKSIKQFKQAKEDSRKYFENAVTERFFVAYASDLTEADLERVCDTYITHGKAENQSDGKERYLIRAYMYHTKGAKPVVKDFTFIVGSNGKIEDFTITDALI